MNLFGETRVFGLPPGADFAAAFACGLRARLAGGPPEALARVAVAVNASRTGRAISAAFETGEAGFLPRIETFERFVAPAAPDAPPGVDRLERRLALARLARGLLHADPALGPLSAAPALAETLTRLLDDMQAERVAFADLAAAEDGDHAEHWRRSLRFLEVLAEGWPAYLRERRRMDPEARRALATDALIEAWRARPPAHPVIAAGSTGSTRVTADLLVAIAGLPQGALVLPGFDFALDEAGWAAVTPEHPQYGFSRLLARLELKPADVRPWAETPPAPRARLMAEALRPAPVTHAWRRALPEIEAAAPAATAGLTLIEAAQPGREAEAVALVMREALERPGRAALVTPDRALARRVTAALDRWGLVPDDSAGRPLALTPPGVFLRLTAEMLAAPFDPARLLALVKHPLAMAGDDRGGFLREVARLEREGLRDRDLSYRLTSAERILAAKARDAAPLAGPLLAKSLAALSPWPAAPAPLADLTRAHRYAAEALAGAALWEEEAGAAAEAAMTGFSEAATAYGEADPGAYPQLLATALDAAGDVRSEAFRPHPRLAIWGPLEARAQSAETMILGGLNEDVWPAPPAVDPWMNRQMRARAGLGPPERRVGLSAHDFLQAASAPRAVLTRARRADGAPTTPSRWLTRLTTLLGGADRGALAAMRARGDLWLARAGAIARPEAVMRPAPRPAPTPPVAARPRRLSVTEVETLIRDPYAIYARHVLRLRALDDPAAPADQRLRGTVLHAAVERFVNAATPWPGPEAAAALFDAAADAAIADLAPPPRQAALWRERLRQLRDGFVGDEDRRRREGAPLAVEAKGRVEFDAPGGPFELTGRADRIDGAEGGVAIYDYKAGAAPSEKQVALFAKQLPLLGAIAAAGGFPDIAAAEAVALGYVSLSAKGGETAIDPDPGALAGLAALIARFDDPAEPFRARAAPQWIGWAGDYDHLSRFGEWSDRAPEAGP